MLRSEKLFLIVTSFAYLVWQARGANPKIKYAYGKNPYDPGDCNSVTKGDLRMVKDRDHLNKLLLCVNHATNFRWEMMSNSGNSYGNYFDPAIDCSSVLDKIPKAKSGVYWIQTGHGPKKAFCDLVTDSGGFMLIGVQNSSRTMDIPSGPGLVDPQDDKGWSSAFGDKKIMDFRIQIGTSKSWSDTKAHWYYRFNKLRKLSNLLLFNDGDCDHRYPGVGDVKFVKDLQENVKATEKFECSRFDSHYHKSLGWGKMNECFGSPCKTGFNYLKLATSGAFSFSVESRKSGFTDTSTKFIGCETDKRDSSQSKCCVCYGPSSDKDYCAPGCTAINGGTVLTDNAAEIHAWYWVRTSLPKRVWKKCMEYEGTDQAGKIIKWHVDGNTGVPKKGPCSYPGDIRFNDGVVVVDNKKALKKLPSVEGLLSYSSDSKDLYLREKHHWKMMAKEEEVEALKTVVKTSENKLENNFQTSQNKLQEELSKSKVEIAELSKKLLRLEQGNQVYSSCKSALEKISDVKHGAFKIAATNGYTYSYCHMTPLPGCSGGGWTLVMKVNGKKETFNHHSSYWSNKKAYNIGGGQTSFDNEETKLPTYWSTPFKQICLGMKVNNDLNFISIPYQASSLFDLIADGKYRATKIGRSKWLSLVAGSNIQPHCGREGFNLKLGRIAIIGNQENDCNTPDSYLGFGGLSKHKRYIGHGQSRISNTCGNTAYYMPSNRNKEIATMGYIFVR